MALMSFSETIFLFFLALIIFGPKKLPEIARQVGKFMNEFRRASNEFKSQIEQEISQLEVDNTRRFCPVSPGRRHHQPELDLAHKLRPHRAEPSRNARCIRMTSPLRRPDPMDPRPAPPRPLTPALTPLRPLTPLSPTP